MLKIGHLSKAIAHAKAIASAKWSVWVKNLKCQKDTENPSRRTLQLFRLKEKEFARKNMKFLRNESMLKIGHHANAIAYAKAITFGECSLLVKN